MASTPVTLTLDKPRSLKWTHRADARLGSLERVPQFSDLASKNARKGFYALCAFVWAAVDDRAGLPDDPTALADWLGEEGRQREALEALRKALVEGGVLEEKKATGPDATGSTRGPGPSSSSAHNAPLTTN